MIADTKALTLAELEKANSASALITGRGAQP